MSNTNETIVVKEEIRQLVSKIFWADFKLNSDGMVPVIVQDATNGDVLMLAYMNEAFEKTLGQVMTYWSRSRDEL